MLSKEECVQAINNWEIAKPNYSAVSDLFDPTATFNFTQQDCDWLNNHNDNNKFHTYIGVNDNALILIVVPLAENGTEKELDFYLTSTLTPLDNELILIEIDTVTTTTKTTLSANLEITKFCEENDLPTYNEPTIIEKATVGDLEKWKNDCLDWFYCECNDFNGQRIFKTFTVPFADLVNDDDEYVSVVALFGFKYADIYAKQIPVLIFVAVDNNAEQGKIIRNTTTTNTKDYSHPCPPLCKNSSNFAVFSD